MARKKKVKKFRQDRKWWFRAVLKLIKLRYKKPNFVFMGDKPKKDAIVLTNHEGADVPLLYELYVDFPMRFWGTHEMNTSFRLLYKHLTKDYYHEIHGWNIHKARLFGLIAAPLTYMFYKGLRLISTYKDARLKESIKESIAELKKGGNIVIFPENPDEGYLEILKEFYPGFTLLGDRSLKESIDLNVFTSYYRKKDHTLFFSKPILYSELKKITKSRLEKAKYLLDTCNALGQIDLDKLEPAV